MSDTNYIYSPDSITSYVSNINKEPSSVSTEDSSEKKITKVEVHKDKDGMFVCPLCQTRHKTRVKIHLHLHFHRKQRPNEYLQMVVVSDDPFKCDKCENCYGTKEELDFHLAKHGPFKCLICDKVFKTKRLEKLHGRVHTDEKPYQCCLCSQKFREKRGLTRHSQIHAGKKYKPDAVRTSKRMSLKNSPD